MTIQAKLTAVQNELKAPKNQRNTFGNYNYRSCEDILEGLKPLLKEHALTLTITDSIELIGTRYYVKATATVRDGTEEISVTAMARESETRKGMDDSQVTGSTSSYARKYALNGLFLIDDTKDADHDDNRDRVANKPVAAPKAVEKPGIAKLPPTAVQIMETLNACKALQPLEVAYTQATTKYSWVEADRANIDQAYQNRKKALQTSQS